VPEVFIWNAINSAGLSQFQGIYVSQWSYPLRAAVVYGFEQSLISNLKPPFMRFFTQIMVCGLIFHAVSNCVGFLGWMKCMA
jgi:hypothetical protein